MLGQSLHNGGVWALWGHGPTLTARSWHYFERHWKGRQCGPVASGYVKKILFWLNLRYRTPSILTHRFYFIFFFIFLGGFMFVKSWFWLQIVIKSGWFVIKRGLEWHEYGKLLWHSVQVNIDTNVIRVPVLYFEPFFCFWVFLTSFRSEQWVLNPGPVEPIRQHYVFWSWMMLKML